MHVEAFGLKAGKTVGNGLKSLAHSIEILQAFFQAQIAEIVRAEFVSQEGGKLLILFDKGVFKVGTKYVMAVIDPFQGGVKLAAEPLCQALAEDF